MNLPRRGKGRDNIPCLKGMRLFFIALILSFVCVRLQKMRRRQSCSVGGAGGGSEGTAFLCDACPKIWCEGGSHPSYIEHRIDYH